MGGAIRLFRVSHQIHRVESPQLRVHDRLHLLLHVQYLRHQHGSAIQRCGSMERLSLWRTGLHHPQLLGEIGLSVARLHRSLLTLLAKDILL